MKQPFMTPKQRQIYQTLMGSYPDSNVHHLLHGVHLQTWEREGLTWLLENKLLGKKLSDWLAIEHGGSIDSALKFIGEQVEKSSRVRALMRKPTTF